MSSISDDVVIIDDDENEDDVEDEEDDEDEVEEVGIVRSKGEVVLENLNLLISFFKNRGRSTSSKALAGAASAKHKVGSRAESTASEAAKMTVDRRGISARRIAVYRQLD